MIRIRQIAAGLLWVVVGSVAITLAAERRPSVLFLAIDDQNDSIGCLNGLVRAKTPHLDRLASRGTLFTNAHCQAPLCNPSRTSVLLGLRPTTTGIYGLSPSYRDVPQWRERTTLPQAFHRAGYYTATTGKIYHGGVAKAGGGEFDVVGKAGGIGARPAKKLVPPTPMGNNPLVDWGVFPHRDEDKGDYQVATWAIEQLESMPRDRDFFLAAGFFLPHVPCYATQRWFDLYPDDDSILPLVRDDDRADTPRFSWYLHWHLPEPRLKWVRENNQWRNFTRSYLATVSFTDAQIGRVLDALERSGRADDTIVIVWSDHGWHLGEKGITGKNTLWERSTRVPLIFAGPGIARGARCSRPAELLDIYPTLVELCSLNVGDIAAKTRVSPQDPPLEGTSLVPQLNDATAPRERPAVTSHNQGNHAVRSEHWRYIVYADGSEELYDYRTDPHEWTNVAADPKHAAVIAEHRRWLPKVDVPPVAGSASRVLTYDRAKDEATWEGTVVRRGDPVPE
jgi:choline-sulfatase